jgi:hypothetical protein
MLIKNKAKKEINHQQKGLISFIFKPNIKKNSTATGSKRIWNGLLMHWDLLMGRMHHQRE